MQYGLIGEKLGHSYSERIHNMIGGYEYRLCPLSPEGMRALLKSRDFRGLNVTIPYKKDVLPFCDVLSGEVERIGSANTLVNRDGALIAYNTDIGGLLSLIQRAGVQVHGKKAVILGSGGTSLTARAACESLGARRIVTVSRKGPVDYEALYRDHADAQVLINATPVGMYPGNGASPVDVARLPALEGVIDVVYNPDRTPLVLAAQKRGLPAAGGLWMLVMQAVLAAEKFLAKSVDTERAADIYAALRAERLNLVLAACPAAARPRWAGRWPKRSAALYRLRRGDRARRRHAHPGNFPHTGRGGLPRPRKRGHRPHRQGVRPGGRHRRRRAPARRKRRRPAAKRHVLLLRAPWSCWPPMAAPSPPAVWRRCAAWRPSAPPSTPPAPTRGWTTQARRTGRGQRPARLSRSWRAPEQASAQGHPRGVPPGPRRRASPQI